MILLFQFPNFNTLSFSGAVLQLLVIVLVLYVGHFWLKYQKNKWRISQVVGNDAALMSHPLTYFHALVASLPHDKFRSLFPYRQQSMHLSVHDAFIRSGKPIVAFVANDFIEFHVK